MVRDILAFLLETEDEGEFKDLYDPVTPELSLDQIKAATPEFFSRKNTRFFGARTIYKYRGNYVLLKNVKRVPGHMYSHPHTETSFVLYRFKRTEERPDGDLYFVTHARDLEDARWMIKHQNFHDWKHRAAGLAEGEEDEGEFKELYAASPWRYEVMEDEGEFKDISHPEIRQIEVHVKTWWRRGYGGTYYTARIIVNDKLVGVLPENGGSENVALEYAFRWLRDNGYIDIERNDIIQSYCERNGIKLIRSTTEVRRERDLDRPL